MDIRRNRDEDRGARNPTVEREQGPNSASAGVLALLLVVVLGTAAAASIAIGLPEALEIAAGAATVAPAIVADTEPDVSPHDPPVAIEEKRDPLIVDDIRTPGQMYA